MIRMIGLAVGVVLAVLGLLFIAQGSGTIAFPPGSPMIGQSAWAYRGVTMVTIGCVLAMFSRNLRRR